LKNLLAYVILTYGMNWSVSGVKKVSSHGWKASHHIWHSEICNPSGVQENYHSMYASSYFLWFILLILSFLAGGPFCSTRWKCYRCHCRAFWFSYDKNLSVLITPT
jgi:hypothetical protein